MRILVLKSVNHNVVTELVEILRNKEVQIDVIDIMLLPGILGRIKSFVSFLKNIIIIATRHRCYDLVSIQYVSLQAVFLLPLLFFFRKKIVLTFWGSDFFSLKKIAVRIINMFSSSLVISVSNVSIKLEINKILPNIDCKVVRFGTKNLRRIDDFERFNVEEKNKIGTAVFKEGGILLGKIFVVCGTNASPNQQHEKIIDAINVAVENKYIVSDDFVFVFAMGYGGDISYKSKIKAKLAEAKFIYQINDQFITGMALAAFRSIPQVLIQLQKTDALSGAMQEVLYAGGLVITGSWLPYDDIRKEGVFWYEIPDVLSLSEMLNEINKKKNWHLESVGKIQNRNIIQNLSSWDVVANDWMELFQK